ncbi:MAG TPA: SoxR reducing system RseC family protein [Gammaproteobacteria bacterium]
MIEERGEVTAVEPPYAQVVTQRRSSCGSCSTKGCGTGALSELFAARSQAMKVLNPIDARVGEQVVLGLEEGALLRGSLAVYMVPLLTMIGGGLIGEAMAPSLALDVASEYLSLPAAFAGLTAGFLWVRRFGRRMASDHRFMAVILRRADEGRLQAIPVTWRSH